MGIAIGGLGSGLPPNIVEQLMDAEKMPIKAMQQQKGKQENKLKLVTDLETKLSSISSSLGTLASMKGFQDMKLTSGDNTIINGTVDPSVGVTGSWNLEVKQLAEKAAAITNGFPDKDKTEIGVGYFRFKTPDGEKDVYINSKTDTLQGAVNAINSARVGVKASIINDRSDPDNPYRLLLSGEALGTDKKIEYPTLYFLDGDQDIFFDKQNPAKNGVLKMDGFEFEVGENVVSDLIPGVTLDLKQASPGHAININVKEDVQAVGGKIKGFVDSVNAVLTFIQSQNRLSEKTDTSQTLGGDSILSSIENRIRRLVQEPQVGVQGPIKRLNQMGLEFSRSGVLDFKQEKFDSVLAKDPVAVQQFFAGDGFNTGFVPAIKREMNAILAQGFGPLTNRKKALQDRIGQIDQRISDKERQLGKKEEALRNKFAKLEETVSRLKGQGGALAGIQGGGQGAGG